MDEGSFYSSQLCNRFSWIFGSKYRCAGYQDVGAGFGRDLSSVPPNTTVNLDME
jgi:hypothetical protein